MKRAAIAGFAAGAAMMIGGAVGAVSNMPDSTRNRNVIAADTAIMNPMIAGQAMLPDRGMVENISASPEHTMLAAALKESGVASALDKGLFTLFAPTDAAFRAGEGVVRGKDAMARQMSYLMVPGRYDSQALLTLIAQGGGEARLRTAEGGVLIARLNGPTNILLMDGRGQTADIAIYDIHDRNGVIHVVSRMLAPQGSARQVAALN